MCAIWLRSHIFTVSVSLPQEKVRWAKAISSWQRSNRISQSWTTCSPWVMEFVATKAMRMRGFAKSSPERGGGPLAMEGPVEAAGTAEVCRLPDPAPLSLRATYPF